MNEQDTIDAIRYRRLRAAIMQEAEGDEDCPASNEEFDSMLEKALLEHESEQIE